MPPSAARVRGRRTTLIAGVTAVLLALVAAMQYSRAIDTGLAHAERDKRRPPRVQVSVKHSAPKRALDSASPFEAKVTLQKIDASFLETRPDARPPSTGPVIPLGRVTDPPLVTKGSLQRLKGFTPPRVRDGERIPRILWTSWKTTKLPKQAKENTDVWHEKEPDWEQRLVTDQECADLVEAYPVLKPRYHALEMSVMRADICRLLIVYAYGGAYRDLDVAHVKPLAKWLNNSERLFVGMEDDAHVCQWFFAFEPENKCLGNIITVITEKIVNVTLDFAKNEELVIDTTGPGAFTVGLEDCPWVWKMHTIEDMTVKLMKHQYAAMNWGGYDSWLEERRRIMGWAEQFPSNEKQKFVDWYVMRPSLEIVPPLDKSRPPLPVRVEQPSHRFGEAQRYYPAEHAVDRDPDTFSMTENFAEQFWQLSVVPTKKGGAEQEEGGAGVDVTCIRVWNKRRMYDTEFHTGQVLKVQFADEGDAATAEWHEVKTVEGERHFGKRRPPFAMFNLSKEFPDRAVGKGHAVRRIQAIRIRPQGDERSTILIGEVYIHSDAACSNSRELRVLTWDDSAETTWSDSPDNGVELGSAWGGPGSWQRATGALVERLRRRPVRCPNTIATGGDDYTQHALCLDLFPPLPTSPPAPTKKPSFSSGGGDGGQVTRVASKPATYRETCRVVIIVEELLDPVLYPNFKRNFGCATHVYSLKELPPKSAPHTVVRVVSETRLDSGDGSSSSSSSSSASQQTISLGTAIANISGGTLEGKGSGVTLLHIDLREQAWTLLPDIAELGRRKLVDELHLELCVKPEYAGMLEASQAATELMTEIVDKQLLESFDLFGWQVTPHSPELVHSILFPVCMQLSLARRGLLPRNGGGQQQQG